MVSTMRYAITDVYIYYFSELVYPICTKFYM